MTLEDLKTAVSEMVEFHGASEEDVVYIRQKDGQYRPVNGLDFDFKGRVIVD